MASAKTEQLTGRHVAAARAFNGVTQKQLAAEIGRMRGRRYHEVAISLIETGAVQCNQGQYRELIDAVKRVADQQEG